VNLIKNLVKYIDEIYRGDGKGMHTTYGELGPETIKYIDSIVLMVPLLKVVNCCILSFQNILKI
jgi:hypothetical protein